MLFILHSLATIIANSSERFINENKPQAQREN